MLKDSEGAPSWEITLSVVISCLITVKFLIGGFHIEFLRWKMDISSLDGAAYAYAITPWVALFMGHHYIGTKWGKEDA